jgi:hypothetical protein
MFQLPEIENMVADIRTAAYKAAQEGALPGWKLIQGRAARKWTDEEETLRKARVWKVKGHALGLPGAAPRVLLSPAKMEAVPGLTKHQLEVLHGLVTKTHGKPKLVPETDPHPAISVDVEGQFAPLDESPTANS